MIIVDKHIKKLCQGTVPLSIYFRYLIGLKPIARKIPHLVDPYDPSLVNPASLDIRIGNTAELRLQYGHKSIEINEFTERYPFWLYPGDRILVASLETINLPPFLTAQFKLKSSRAREFYQHGFAGFADPGWNGSKLTMELFNADTNKLPLYPGLKIGQLIFSLTFGLPEADYSLTGRYNNDQAASVSKG